MPEGDDVHGHARLLAPLLVGHPIRHAFSRWPGAVVGLKETEVTGIECLGKHLLLHFGDGTTARIHLGMTGGWRKAGPFEALSLSPGDISLRLDTDHVAVICTRAPTLDRYPTRERTVHPVLTALGPDVLADDFDPAGVTPSTRPTVAEALLDQQAACGIGNVYKAEVLFLERTDPFTPSARISEAEWTSLYTRAAALMRANLGPGPRRTVGADRRGVDHWVYGRSGRPCLRCGTRVAFERHHGDPPRMTYWCPRCQPEEA